MEVEVKETALGILADIKLKPGAIQRKARPRTLEGRSSCGLCGVQRLADAVRPLPRLDGAGARSRTRRCSGRSTPWTTSRPWAA
jgi:FdhD protein